MTNLFYHLKTKHVTEHQPYCQATQPTPRSSLQNAGQKKQEVIQISIKQSFSKGTPYSRKSPRWIEMTGAITVYLCKDTVPFQTVERRGFTATIRDIDPRHEVPSRKFFTGTEMLSSVKRLKRSCVTLNNGPVVEPYHGAFTSLNIHYTTDD